MRNKSNYLYGFNCVILKVRLWVLFGGVVQLEA